MAKLTTQVRKLQKANMEQRKEIDKLKAQLEKDEKSWSAGESSLRYSETFKSLILARGPSIRSSGHLCDS